MIQVKNEDENKVKIVSSNDVIEVPGIVQLIGYSFDTELNSMTIEYKEPGESWDKIGDSKGCIGKSCAIIRESAIEDIGTVYYRAKSADNDGNISISEIKPIEFVDSKQ